MKRRKGRSLSVMVVLIWAMLALSLHSAQAAPPAGVLKEAIHWGLSADWLDPATNSALIPAQITLYLFHDALLKPMPRHTTPPAWPNRGPSARIPRSMSSSSARG